MTGGQVLGVADAAAGVEFVAVFSVVGIASHDRLGDDKAGWEQGVGDGDRALLSVLFAEAAAQAAQPGADAGPGAGGDPGCLDHRGPEAGFGGDGAIAGQARDDQAGGGTGTGCLPRSDQLAERFRPRSPNAGAAGSSRELLSEGRFGLGVGGFGDLGEQVGRVGARGR